MLLLSPTNWSTLCRVHHEVNDALRYVSDLDKYARPEFWTHPRPPAHVIHSALPVEEWEGDCEDAALFKQMSLINLGWDYKCLRLMLCKNQKNLGHCLLSVDFRHEPKENKPVPLEPEIVYYLDLTGPPLGREALLRRGYHSFVRQRAGSWLWYDVTL